MASGHLEATGELWLGAGCSARLLARLEAALARADRIGEPTLAAVTARPRLAVDPAAIVMSARGDHSEWGVFEQPERDGLVLATLGSARTIEAEGSERFTAVSEAWERISAGAVADDPDGPPGAGPIAFGGFSFEDRSRRTGPWRGFAAASMVVPTLAFVRQGPELWVTVQAMVEPGSDADGLHSQLLSMLAGLDPNARLPMDGIDPVDLCSVESALAPEHYVSAVHRAITAIEEGRIDKAVLAREVLAERSGPHDPAYVLGVLRDVFPSCFLFAVGRGDATFIGASPELLIRREGLHASTVALAGSAPRSADPAVDDHIGERLLRSRKDRAEQAIVTQRISRNLEPHSVWVSAADEPQLARIANVQHLATPIRARLREPVAAVELVGHLHPTPAVGGEPWPAAHEVIAEVEGLDRGWYAAPIGWCDGAGNGEFAVALRCALLRGGQARCYAGVGVVEGSDPAAELAETELKLQAILPIVSA